MKLATAICLCLGIITVFVHAEDSAPIIIVFYQEGCTSCERLDQFLDPLPFEAPASALVGYGVNEPESQRPVEAHPKVYEKEPDSVPVVFGGNKDL